MKKLVKTTIEIRSKQVKKKEKLDVKPVSNKNKSVLNKIKLIKSDEFEVLQKSNEIRPSNKFIKVNNATLHTLKGISVEIPRNRFTVITGVSGSGKSTLAFDTLYAEGQRRFVESISSYARQFLERMNKPEVDSIIGLPPAIAIQQLPTNRNPRSTVGTNTEIYDYLRLLFGRIGKTYDEKTGLLVKKDTPDSVVKHLDFLEEGTKLFILFELGSTVIDVLKELKKYFDAGFFRIILKENNELIDLGVNPPTKKLNYDDFFILVDRLVYKKDTENLSRLTESIESAFRFGNGVVTIRDISNNKDFYYSNRFECNETKVIYDEPDPRIFVFNSPFGACEKCSGSGTNLDIDPDLVIPNKSKSLKEQAIHPFTGTLNTNIHSYNQKVLINEAEKYGIDTEIPYKDLSEDEKKSIWDGFGKFIGIDNFFEDLSSSNNRYDSYRFLNKYQNYINCRTCNGSRLKLSARQVFISGYNIPQLVNLQFDEFLEVINNFNLSETDQEISKHILKELKWRSQLLIDIGLEYLSLNRLTHTLSGGEAQRINISTALGSSLVGTLYVLDEPSIGLHSRDTNRLINILHKLRNLGNTVLVVEHDEDIMEYSDFIIDMGPFAGEFGGEITFEGTYKELLQSDSSLTGKYLSGKFNLEFNNYHRMPEEFVTLTKPMGYFLDIDEIKIPLNCITTITGVSGSGKSTLIREIFYNGIIKELSEGIKINKNYDKLSGLENIKNIEFVDQSSIGKSSRSTPATYTKVFDDIRQLFANTQASKQLGWRDGHFSFNVPGGRCEACEGEGKQVIEMQFLSDVTLECEVCHGKRYKKEVLNVTYKDKNIVDVLNMTIDEATVLFADVSKIIKKLKVLQNVGLGYLKLGQPASQLSGGEAQRLKLSTFLGTQDNFPTIFIFDEPTTGLHFYDISKLMSCFNILIEAGHTIILIEHNLNVISSADWLIDLGPEAGKNGGKIVGVGKPDDISKLETHTGKALKKFYLNKK